MIIPSIFCVLAAFAITPDVPTVGSLDVREYYMSKRIPVFSSLAAFAKTNNLPDKAIAGMEKMDSVVGMFLFPLMLVSLVLTKRPWVHVSAMAIVMMVVILFMSVEIEQFQSRFVE